METMYSFSLQLPNPSAFSALEKSRCPPETEVGGRTGAGLLQAFHPAIADGLKPDLQPKKKKEVQLLRTNTLAFSKA